MYINFVHLLVCINDNNLYSYLCVRIFTSQFVLFVYTKIPQVFSIHTLLHVSISSVMFYIM
jgi:hypothetical protein